MYFQNLTIRVKLQLGFGMLAALVVVVSGIALTQLHRSTESFSSFINGINARADVANQFRTAVDRRAIAARNLVLVTKASDLELEKADVSSAHADVQAKLKLLMDMTANATDASQQARDLVAEMARIEKLYTPVALGIVQLALNGQHEAAITKLDDECRPLLASLIGTTQAYAQLARDRQQQVISDYQAQYQTQVVMLMSFSAGAVLLGILAGWLITRAIVRPIQTAVGVAQTVASGDLTSHFDIHGKDETGDLLRALRGMNDHLLQTVGSVRAISNSIGTAAQEIAAGNVDLSQRTEEQAASLGETASSMEQLTATVTQNSANAQQASTLATQASDVANNGSAAVSRVVDTIRAIQDSSSKIADITGIIEGIAFQTNILALNAAVEAARAGEQGRGFAVVASEVRSLAQRSSSAAKEIKTLISASVQKIQDGAALAGEAGTTMTDVTHAVRRVTDLIAEIASASTEQSHGIEQVNRAIAQMDEVTQQNAALVEEAAASSQALDDQGRHLSDAVSRFVLDAQGGQAPTNGHVWGGRAQGGRSGAMRHAVGSVYQDLERQYR